MKELNLEQMDAVVGSELTAGEVCFAAVGAAVALSLSGVGALWGAALVSVACLSGDTAQ